MAKKSFLGTENPAMQFIGGAVAPVQEEKPKKIAANKTPSERVKNTDNAASSYDVHNVNDVTNADSIKHAVYEYESHAAPKKETRSRRTHLLLPPSLHEDLSKIAYVRQTSVNDLIIRVMEEYAKKSESLIKRYDDFTGEEF